MYGVGTDEILQFVSFAIKISSPAMKTGGATVATSSIHEIPFFMLSSLSVVLPLLSADRPASTPPTVVTSHPLHTAYLATAIRAIVSNNSVPKREKAVSSSQHAPVRKLAAR